jgi:hypothetical protein
MHSIQIRILKRPSQNNKLVYYTFEWGKEKGERIATGIFTYKRPANEIQKHLNSEALAILEAKRSQLILSHQATKKLIVISRNNDSLIFLKPEF